MPAVHGKMSAMQMQLHHCGSATRAGRTTTCCQPRSTPSISQCLAQKQRPTPELKHTSPTARHRRSQRHAAVASSQEHYVGSLSASELKFAIIVARFNDLITRPLLQGALEAFERHGGDTKNADVVWVPGSFELPIVAKSMAKSGKYDAVIAIGAVIRGSTTHYEAVANAAAGGLLGASQESGVPVIFGVLTTENMEQAMDRAGGKAGNKGAEAAVTAVEMANLLKTLREEGKASPAW